MDLKKNILLSLLLAMGFILHQITPGILGGMKPDLLLSFIFICLLLGNNLKSSLLIGSLSGLLSALTTTFPGGQLPNLIDKLVTCFILFFIIRLMCHRKPKTSTVAFISFIGTIVSGSVFLLSALLVVELPAPFMPLFLSIVLPATVVNTIITTFLYNIVQSSLKIVGIDLHS